MARTQLLGTAKRCVEGLQIGGLDALDALLVAGRVEAVAALAEQRPPHGEGGALEQVVLLRADAGQLDLALALQCRGGEGRMQQNVGHQVQSRGEISAKDLGVDAEAVVAAVAVNAATDGLDFPGDLLGGTPRRAFQQHLAGELGDAVVGQGLGEHPALEHRAELDERQPVVLFHQQAQAVGERELLHRLVPRGFVRGDRLGCRARGQQRVKGAVLRREILAGDALEVGGRDAFDGRQVALGEIQVVGRQPASAQVLRLALHGLARGEGGGDELLHRLAQFLAETPAPPSSSRLRPAWRRAAATNLSASTVALRPKRPGLPGL